MEFEMKNKIKALLEKASKYIAKTDLDNDSKINLLKLFHAQTDELSFCRILEYIIDPKNEQYFLKSFIENVLNFKSEDISDDAFYFQLKLSFLLVINHLNFMTIINLLISTVITNIFQFITSP